MTWYVATLEPRALSPSKHLADDTIVSAALRDAGISFYMPFESEVIIHRSTKKKIIRRRPLVPGYAFIDGVRDFEGLRKCDGIRDVIKSAGCPVPIHEFEVWQLMADEAAINAEFDHWQALAAKREGLGTRATIESTFKKGSSYEIGDGHLLKGELITMKGTAARGRIEGVIARLNNYPVSIEAVHLVSVG